MVQVIDEHLAKAIADIAIFLEFSDEGVVDGDASVAAMEQLSAELQRMAEPARAALAQRFKKSLGCMVTRLSLLEISLIH